MWIHDGFIGSFNPLHNRFGIISTFFCRRRENIYSVSLCSTHFILTVTVDIAYKCWSEKNVYTWSESYHFLCSFIITPLGKNQISFTRISHFISQYVGGQAEIKQLRGVFIVQMHQLIQAAIHWLYVKDMFSIFPKTISFPYFTLLWSTFLLNLPDMDKNVPFNYLNRRRMFQCSSCSPKVSSILNEVRWDSQHCSAILSPCVGSVHFQNEHIFPSDNAYTQAHRQRSFISTRCFTFGTIAIRLQNSVQYQKLNETQSLP